MRGAAIGRRLIAARCCEANAAGRTHGCAPCTPCAGVAPCRSAAYRVPAAAAAGASAAHVFAPAAGHAPARSAAVVRSAEGGAGAFQCAALTGLRCSSAATGPFTCFAGAARIVGRASKRRACSTKPRRGSARAAVRQRLDATRPSTFSRAREVARGLPAGRNQYRTGNKAERKNTTTLPTLRRTRTKIDHPATLQRAGATRSAGQTNDHSCWAPTPTTGDDYGVQPGVPLFARSVAVGAPAVTSASRTAVCELVAPEYVAVVSA